MAVDVAAVCAEASGGPQGFFVGIAVLYSVYILVDVLIAARVVTRKVRVHNTKDTTSSS
jgi:hypothetical protein